MLRFSNVLFLSTVTALLLTVIPYNFSSAAEIDTVNGKIKTDILTAQDKKTLGLDTGATQFLCSVSNKGCTDHITGLNPAFAECLAKFIKAGQAAGQSMRINSGYRSPTRQAELFNQAVSKYGSESAARKWVAPPGKSNHGRGIAADLSNSGGWAHANAGKFGLNFRMSHEPWHVEPGGGGCNSGTGANDTSTGNQNGDGGAQNGQPSPGDTSGAGGNSGAGSGGNESSGGGQGAGANSAQTQNQLPPQQPVKPVIPVTPIQEASGEATLSCSPEAVSLGEPVTLGWECPAGTSLIRGTSTDTTTPFNVKNALIGSLRIIPKKNATYGLSCLKQGRVLGKATCTVVVKSKKQVITARLTATPKSVNEGESVDISWTSQNARSCSVTGPGIASASKSGLETSAPLFETATFVLECKPLQPKDVPLIKKIEVVVLSTSMNEEGSATQRAPSTETEFTNPLQ